MALIQCPECSKAISDKAHTCIHCGYPLSEAGVPGEVWIKIPSNVAGGEADFFSFKRVAVKDPRGQILWEGNHGENARFKVEEPTKIRIELGGFADDTIGIVYPGKRYTLVRDHGMHMWATYRLTEVDIIDSE